jgi:pimeloyl-ACP methyl ester carboxylesterase
MKPVVYLVHGFNELNNEQIFKLGSFFEAANYPVIRVDYGWTGLFSVRFATARESTRLAKAAAPGSIAIGHSNGFNVIYQAMEKGAKFDKVVGINPALMDDLLIETEAYIYYTSDDFWLKVADVLRKVSPLRVFGLQTKWGRMGQKGYRGPGACVTNINLQELFQEEKVGHGGAFRWDRIDKVARDIIARIQ